MKSYNYLILSILFLTTYNCKDQSKIEKKPVSTATVKAIVSPTGQNSSLPFLFSNKNKTLMSWVEKVDDSLHYLKYAFYTENAWGKPKTILKGTNWFVNWADFPMIAENKGNLWSHVLKKSSVDTYSYDVKMNVKPKNSSAWLTNMPLHTDETPTEHGFVTVLPYKDAFFVTWLDGRNTEKNAAGERGAMTIRSAEVTAKGTVLQSTELDARTCDCCQTSAAITNTGTVVVYRNRSEEEIRDIYLVRKVNGKWTTPKSIHNDGWKIKGCPVNGPKAAAHENTLAVAWYTEAHNTPKVQIVFSADGGLNFDAPVSIATENALGRVDLLLLDSGTAIVSWMETKSTTAVLKAVKVTRNNKMYNPLEISVLDASRKTGFPQMERVGDQVLFAWTNVSENNIETASVSLDWF